MDSRKAGKGLFDTVHRAAILPMRYGIASSRIRKRVALMVSTLAREDAVPTIAVTGINLARHPDVIRDLAGADIAVHGFRHLDYTRLTLSQQGNDLNQAVEIFAGAGIEARGFRAPYLARCDSVLQLLGKRGFLFDSSAYWIAVPRAADIFHLVERATIRRYPTAANGICGRIAGSNLVELPVGLPDDEILVDSLRIRNPTVLARVLNTMLDAAAVRGGLLVLSIHPERFHFFVEAVSGIVKKSSDQGGWNASLSEIATWFSRNPGTQDSWPSGYSFALAITGDLDAVTLLDFRDRIHLGEAFASGA